MRGDFQLSSPNIMCHSMSFNADLNEIPTGRGLISNNAENKSTN